MEKKLGLETASLATFTDLTLSRNPFRVKAYEEIAKYYEHRERNFTMALECVHAARAIEDLPALEVRESRLRARTERTAKQLRLAKVRRRTRRLPVAGS